MTDDGIETELDAYRERVDKPLWRFFRAYAPGKGAWLAVGLLTSVVASLNRTETARELPRRNP